LLTGERRVGWCGLVRRAKVPPPEFRTVHPGPLRGAGGWGVAFSHVPDPHELPEGPVTTDQRRIHDRAGRAVSNMTTLLGSMAAIGAAVTLVALWAIGLAFAPGGYVNPMTRWW
jgi:hypothetical protein